MICGLQILKLQLLRRTGVLGQCRSFLKIKYEKNSNIMALKKDFSKFLFYNITKKNKSKIYFTFTPTCVDWSIEQPSWALLMYTE